MEVIASHRQTIQAMNRDYLRHGCLICKIKSKGLYYYPCKHLLNVKRNLWLRLKISLHFVNPNSFIEYMLSVLRFCQCQIKFCCVPCGRCGLCLCLMPIINLFVFVKNFKTKLNFLILN